jgi:hypothetical protein
MQKAMETLASRGVENCAAEIPAERCLSWLDSPLDDLALKMLTAPMPRGRGTLYFCQRPENLQQRIVDGKKHIVFFSYYPSIPVVKKSIVLRESQKYFTTLIGCCIREDSEPWRFFDQIYEVTDYREMLALAIDCTPWRLHAFVQPLTIGLIAVCAKIMGSVSVVVDVNDSLLYIEKNPDSATCMMEREILKRADAFAHKMPAAAIAEMRARWKLETPAEQIHSLPLRSLFQHGRPFGTGSPVKLVYAGGVMPYDIAVANGHGAHIFDPLIHTVGQSPCALAFLVNQNAREMYWHEHQRYLDLQAIYPKFSFLQGVPFFRLPALLSTFDLAIYYENSQASSYNPKHYRYNMATKIFSYIEGGLPVMVPESAEYIADFVVSQGMGMSYRLESLVGLLRNMGEQQADRLYANTLRYREGNDMKTALARLERLYDY